MDLALAPVEGTHQPHDGAVGKHREPLGVLTRINLVLLGGESGAYEGAGNVAPAPLSLIGVSGCNTANSPTLNPTIVPIKAIVKI